jgi:hypothetical protein
MIEEVGKGIVWSLERLFTFCVYCDMPKDILENLEKKRKLSKQERERNKVRLDKMLALILRIGQRVLKN